MAWPCLTPSAVLRYPNTSRDLRPNSKESTQKKGSVGVDRSPIVRLRKISEDLGLPALNLTYTMNKVAMLYCQGVAAITKEYIKFPKQSVSSVPVQI